MATHVDQYKPVPVDVAKQIADRFDKAMVVILAYDVAHELTHTTTYGTTEYGKENAAGAGAYLTQTIGSDLSQKIEFEDFHTDYDPARAKVQAEALREMTSYAVTCLKCNTTDWMEGLVERINMACELLRDEDRFELVKGCHIRKVTTENTEVTG